MKKIAQGLFLNWHLVLDTTITHFLAIYFARAQRFDLAAGVAITDSLLKLLFALPCASISTRLRVSARVNLCLFMRPTLTLIWLIGLSFGSIAATTSLIIAVFFVFKVLLIIDTAASADFIFLSKEHLEIDLSQSNSIQNIIARASVAVAPAFSLSILSHNLDIAYVISSTLIITTISAIVLKTAYRLNKLQEEFKKSTKTASFAGLNLSEICSNRYMRWGLLYQLFVNFSFGGITYLLIINISKNINSFANELSTLYIFFFVYSVAISFFGDKVIPAHRLRSVSQIITATGVLSIALSFSLSPSLNLMLCAAMGLLYAYELAAIQKVLMPKLRGFGYIRYAALSKTGGRAASASGVALLGIAIEMGIPSASLFLACGLSGLGCAFALHVANPERQRVVSALR
jgi:hypothetical protein